MVTLGAFGAMVRRVRRGRGFTQGELALRAGVEIKTVGRIEGGKGNPRLETLWSIAAALDTTLGELVCAAEGGDAS
jgi:transcriptional regulator with XRE-family HTH domain